MDFIIPIRGNVDHVITLDPSVWIFDDRRIDLTTYFTEQRVEKDELLEYKKEMGAHWSREIMEGAVFPPTLKTEKRFEKTKVLTGTFGMNLRPFIANAKPRSDANTIVIETADGNEHAFPLTDAEQLILKYSQDGKPLREDGPVHILFTDGSNLDNPIRRVKAIRIE